MFIVCHDEADVRPLEAKLLSESRLLKKVDGEKPAENEKKPVEKEQGNRPHEYRIAATRKYLNRAVQQVLNDNKKMWDMVVVFGPGGWVIKKGTVKGLGPAKSAKMEAIEQGEPLKVGDRVFVVYKERGGVPKISEQGKIVKKMKFNWRVHWIDWKGSPYTNKYKLGDVYKLKKEAEYAKKYWYEDKT